jgi:hypothetical protein
MSWFDGSRSCVVLFVLIRVALGERRHRRVEARALAEVGNEHATDRVVRPSGSRSSKTREG